jgi:hypothetical protein
VEVFDPASTKSILALVFLHITPLNGPSRNTLSNYVDYCMHIRYRRKVFTEPLPRNSSGIFFIVSVVVELLLDALQYILGIYERSRLKLLSKKKFFFYIEENKKAI